MSDREFLTEPYEEEDEERTAGSYVHPALRSYMYSPIGGDSDSPEEDTVKCNTWSEGARPAARADSSDTTSSSSSSDCEDRRYEGIRNDDYHTLTPSRRLDTSTRRDDNFKWMPSGEIVDEEEGTLVESAPKEYSSASLDRRRKVTSDRGDRDRKSRSSLSTKPPQHPSSVRASPGPRRPRIDNSPDMQRRWNSYEHFRWPEGGWWPPMCWCHGPPGPPPCCMHDRSWPSHPSLPPTPPRLPCKNDAEERVRRLEADKESLQLQVQVLSEQISAQSEKMNDLERALHDTRQRLDDAEQRLQKEMLQRSSLETQKLELLSKLSEVRLRAAERGVLERSPPPEPAPSEPIHRPQPPRTPPANYGRQIERNTHMYSSLPRATAFDARHFVEKEEAAARTSPSPSLREPRAGAGAEALLEGGELARGGHRATAQPRLQRDRPGKQIWEETDIRQWDCETTCSWLESLSLEMYCAAARTWLQGEGERRGVLAAATSQVIEKELAIKHPMHKKKILLGITDLTGAGAGGAGAGGAGAGGAGAGDAWLAAAGRLDAAWAARWLDDAGLAGARAAALEARLDGRALHRLSHHELHHHLRVTQQLHALSVKRGIQVLRENMFNPDTMIRRGPEDEGAEEGEGAGSQLARWSSHRVMQWLKQIDLAEYAPNLRGAGVHGGLLLLEARFTAELLAALLNIPASKTLLRRHLTQRFNDLLGREVIQQKRNAEQTLGYQPLTITTKYKVPKKSQFTLKRKKSKDDLDLSELVCPLTEESSGDINTSPMMRVKAASDVASAVSLPRDAERSH